MEGPHNKEALLQDLKSERERVQEALLTAGGLEKITYEADLESLNQKIEGIEKELS